MTAETELTARPAERDEGSGPGRDHAARSDRGGVIDCTAEPRRDRRGRRRAAGAAAPVAGGLAPLASRGYRCCSAGTTLTMAGYFAQMVAQGWLIYDLTGSPTWLGIVSFANGIPMLLLALPAGVLVDRSDRRKMLVLGPGDDGAGQRSCWPG